MKHAKCKRTLAAPYIYMKTATSNYNITKYISKRNHLLACRGRVQSVPWARPRAMMSIRYISHIDSNNHHSKDHTCIKAERGYVPHRINVISTASWSAGPHDAHGSSRPIPPNARERVTRSRDKERHQSGVRLLTFHWNDRRRTAIYLDDAVKLRRRQQPTRMTYRPWPATLAVGPWIDNRNRYAFQKRILQV